MIGLPDNRTKYATISHLCFWLVFATQIILFRSTGPIDGTGVVAYMIHMAIYVSIFYINTSYVLPKYMYYNWKMVALCNIIILAICTQLHYLLHFVMDEEYGINHHRLGISTNIIVCGTLFIALSLINYHISRLANKEKEQRLTLHLATETELEKLKSQLHPHMVFNTLNNIYALVTINPDKAQASIQHMSAILRYLIKDKKVADQQRMVPISTEAKFVRDLISMYKLKMTNTMSVVYNENISEHPNAPCLILIFMNLIENAFTYGTSTAEDSPVEITLEALSDTEIHFRTKNRIFKRENQTAHIGNGTGIANVRRRLELVYGRDATLKVERGETEFVTDMRLLYTERNYYQRNKQFNKIEGEEGTDNLDKK